MKTAKQLINSVTTNKNSVSRMMCEALMKSYAKQAIDRCAKVARADMMVGRDEFDPDIFYVDKESILKVKKELH